MKRFLVASLALAMVLIWTVPVMAIHIGARHTPPMRSPEFASDSDLSLKFRGHYRVQGFMEKDYALTKEPTTSTDSYMDMRFRLETTFQITDRLAVITRFDALEDKKWGSDINDRTDGFNWDRTYMRIDSPIGRFEIGRRSGGTWGTLFADNETERDRIWYLLPIGKFGLLAVYEKNNELDFGNVISDGDVDTYYLAPFFRTQMLETGVLYGFTNFRRGHPALGDDLKRHLVAPYFVTSFGPLSLQGEIMYFQGEWDSAPALGGQEVKVRTMAANLEGTFTVGPAAVQAGYAFMSGDKNGLADRKIESYDNFGIDWEKLYILTTSTGPTYDGLGGAAHGNLAKTNPSGLGVHLVYAGAGFDVMNNVNLSALWGYARTHKERAGVDRSIGHEVDLALNWQIYPNLSYTAIGAWFTPGKYWESVPGIGQGNLEDAYSVFHNLTLSF